MKTGHAGTLDPLATGVLVLCTGRATKRIEELQLHSKDVLIFVLVFIVLVALLSLLVDLCNPNIGWVRA